MVHHIVGLGGGGRRGGEERRGKERRGELVVLQVTIAAVKDWE